jgi:branched-chain amino acid transport system permease protein
VNLTNVAQNVVDALALGSIYALFALGIALVFGVLRLVNLAHGEIITAAGFALVITDGWPWWARIVAALLAGVIVSGLMHRLVFRPLEGVPAMTLMVASLALSYLLQSLALQWQGPRPRGVKELPLLSDSVTILDVQISALSLVSVLVTVLLLAALVALLRSTDFGLRIRAAAEDFTMARMLGIQADRVVLVAFGIAGVLAALGGVLLVSQTGTVSPTIGLNVVLFGLIACVVGGLGTLGGAVLGGFLIGSAAVALQATLPLELRPYRDAFVFGAVFLVILFRPEGLIRSNALQERV